MEQTQTRLAAGPWAVLGQEQVSVGDRFGFT